MAQLAADDARAAYGVRVEIIRDTIPVEAEPADLEIRRAESVVAQRPLIGVVGHGGSRGSLAAAPVYNDAGVVHIVPSGTSRLLARAGRWTFTLPPNDSVEGAFIAGFVRERLRARRVALLYVYDEYGVGLRDGIRAALGPVEVTRESRYDMATDMATLVALVARGPAPDAVIIAGRTDAAAAVARGLIARGIAVPVVAGDGALNLPDLPRLAGPRGDGRVYAATFWLPAAADSAGRHFAAEVRRRFGREATATDALVYDAVCLLVAAARAVGREPEAIRGYLAGLGVSRPHFQGVTGPIGFGAGAAGHMVMGVLRDSSFVPVAP